ncbi:MAG: hypothetical protein FD173_290 [Gallionellaceae bacterium]|nr:MAG: hypothetical protein FD173_290 [Gallionellaceae bacterium]
MLHFVPRKCSTREEDPSKNIIADTEHFRQWDAYVLLGDPGAGKSRLFKDEAAKTENGYYLTARDFIDYEREEWRRKVLFIDGLDEVRAGRNDPHTPLGAIRGKLDKLGCPRFRLSCRAADWHGNSDAEALKSCAPNGAIAELYLEPLSHEQVTEILIHDSRVPDAQGFLDNAGKFNLEGLLYNPQTLDMMIAAVEGDTWPTSKLEVYESACKKLAVDSRVHRQPYPIPQMLDAAGWLFAVQLLANAPAIRAGNAQAQGEIGLSDLEATCGEVSQAALGTRLFTSLGNDEYAYIHRSVAEYLGARYIAEKIKQGLPINRMLALTTGFDGGVVAALRGLMAWLAALNMQARDRMIEIDPLGMVLYGDVQLLLTVDKVHLLDALQLEAAKPNGLGLGWRDARSFSTLTTRDMVSYLRGLLQQPSRESPHENILICVFDGLYQSPALPELKTVLMAIVRDQTHWEAVRRMALEVYIQQHSDDTQSLLLLADDIRLNKVEDTGNTLSGLLLEELFPAVIAAGNIFQYLKPNYDDRTYYDVFWDDRFIERVTDQDVPILLDELSRRGADFLRLSSIHDLFGMAGQLLIRGLQLFGSEIPVARLFDWLSVGMDQYHHSSLTEEHQQQIKVWVETNPNRYLSILGEGVRHIPDGNNFGYEVSKVIDRLYGAKEPENLGQWWLTQAQATSAIYAKKQYFCQAFFTLSRERGCEGLSLEYFEQYALDHSEFAEVYQGLIACVIDEQHIEHQQQKAKWAKEREDNLKSRIDYFQQHKASIADGSAHPQVLHDLAVMWGDQSGKTGEDRLSKFLNNDDELISAAKSGLLKILNRPDLPMIKDIFSLAVEQRQHFIRSPFLICMEKLYQENSAMLSTLSDELAEMALAFWYTYGAGNEPAWVKPLCLSRPILTAKVLTEYVRTMLLGKVQHITGLYQLVHDSDYRDIARLVAMPLLESYPIRSTQQQISTLEYLLKAAIAYVDKASLLALIERKLALKLDVAQSVYWLATGLLVVPEKYESIVRKQVGGKVVRINHLSSFMYSGRNRDKDYDLPVTSMGLLIELLGPRCAPDRIWGVHVVRQAENERDCVQALLNKLGSMPDEDAGRVLSGLLTLPELSAWHEAIRSVQQTQQVSRREATFRHPGVDQVIQTLDNDKPANVADLAALASDFLGELAEETHASNTDCYKRFWNVDGYNKPLTPRPENSCRDYLVERLKPLLVPFDVDVQPETREAESKRADIRLSFRGNGEAFHLPIEIKLDHSPDLWRAIHEQLIPLYTIAPETGGRGLLMVIWFNDSSKRSSAPPSGTKPKTAEELAARLQELLTQEERKLIGVFVLDASK